MKCVVALVVAASLAGSRASATILESALHPADIQVLGDDSRSFGGHGGAGPWAVVGDFNGDGVPDLATCGPTRLLSVGILLGRRPLPAIVDFSATAPDVLIREDPGLGWGSGLAWFPRYDASDWFPVLGAGDLTGDGIDDLAISAHEWPGNPRRDGMVVIVPGRAAWPAEILVDPDTWAPAILGPPVDGLFGGSLQVGDLDGDGAPDLAVGAHAAPLAFGGSQGTGRVYVVRGPVPDARVSVDDVGALLDSSNGVAPDGSDGSARLGCAIASGFLSPEVPRALVLGQHDQYMYGRVLLLDAARVEGRVTVRESPALMREILGPLTPGDILGQAVALADLDCSGWGDLVVNNWNARRPDGSQFNRGRIDVYGDVARQGNVLVRSLSFYGSARRFDPFEWTGVIQGLSLADLDGDGFDDFVVFEPFADGLPGSRQHSGQLAVVWNRPDLPPELDLDIDSEFQVTVFGSPDGNSYGFPIAPADVDGDGRLDLLAGAADRPNGGAEPDGILDVFTRNLHVTTISAEAGPDQTVELSAGCEQEITLDAGGSVDRDGHAMRHRWYEGTAQLAEGEVVTVTLATGEHCIRLFTTSDGGWAQDKVHVSVREAVPPEIRGISVEPESLWPANHRMRAVHVVLDAWDECTPAEELKYRLLSVTSSEPENGVGDGRSQPDMAGWEIGTPDFDGELRAERSAHGRGREYTLTYEVLDAAGNAATASVVVAVSHDRGRAPRPLPGRRLGWR